MNGNTNYCDTTDTTWLRLKSPQTYRECALTILWLPNGEYIPLGIVPWFYVCMTQTITYDMSNNYMVISTVISNTPLFV